MNASQGPRRRREHRGGAARGGAGGGRRPQSSGNGGGQKGSSTFVRRTTVRSLTALGAYVAQDLRDPDGLTRPMIRRAALRLQRSHQEPLRRLGGAYLRRDPLTPRELAAGGSAEPREPGSAAPPGATDDDAVIDIAPEDVTEVD
jgi:hypothetical protein